MSHTNQKNKYRSVRMQQLFYTYIHRTLLLPLRPSTLRHIDRKFLHPYYNHPDFIAFSSFAADLTTSLTKRFESSDTFGLL